MNSYYTASTPCINRGAPPLQHTQLEHYLTPFSSSCSFTFLVALEQGKATSGILAHWKKRHLGMNRNMSSFKVMLSSYIYSHTYELEYSCYVIILIYELVYSLYAMKVAYLTLCLTTHIT